MVNTARGEVGIVIGGKRHKLCLTLGALAEIEDGLGLKHWGEIEERLTKPRVADILVVLSALLDGGGNPVSVDDLKHEQIPIRDLTVSISQAFAAGNGDDEETDPGNA